MNNKHLLKRAYRTALQSRDPSTQNAALLVDDTGNVLVVDVNRFPNGIAETEERWKRPLKYKLIEHAERNVIYRAARIGVATAKLTMVCPWAPCTECARGIIQAGLSRLTTHHHAYLRTPERWKIDVDMGLAMLEEAEIDVVMVDEPIGARPIRHIGESWCP